MWGRQRAGSVLCPGCGSLVGVNDAQCLTCGRRRPGLWGFAALLRNTGEDMGFLGLVLWGCGALFIATLAVNPQGIEMGGLLSMLSPDSLSLYLFGASGAVPVFEYGRFWTVLSAGWLHGGLLHIVFNMLAARTLIPVVAHLYGPARTVIIYTLACAAGFSASSAAGRYLTFMPWFLRGGQLLTIGASASIFGLIGAVAYYGRRGGSRLAAAHAREWALSGLVMGLVVPGIDNWAHLGGLAGGYLAARWLDPLLPERGDHVLAAVACLVLTLASIVASIVTGLPDVRG